MKYTHAYKQGFTIVELLVVIVIIGILATVSIVAYDGVQQRAKNATIINAASQSLKAIETYIATTGEFPLRGVSCITTETYCNSSYSNETPLPVNPAFETNMATVGSLPKNIPVSGARLRGLLYAFDSSVRVDGELRPATLRYYLFGEQQRCGLPGTVSGAYPDYVLSTTGYTTDERGTGKTKCEITISKTL